MYSDQGHGDGGSLFGGGGFMPSQSGPISDSAYASANRRSGPVNQALLPLTVKQISLASQRSLDDSFTIDGQDVTNVTLVGLVTDRVERVTEVCFVLDDGTGKIMVHRWVDSQETFNMTEAAVIRNYMYIRLHGHLHSFQGKLGVKAFCVRPITDFNEVTFHFLECIYVHAKNTKNQGSGMKAPGTNVPSYLTGAKVEAKPNVGFTSNYASTYAPPSSEPSRGSLDDCQKRVREILEEPSSLAILEGLHVEEIARRLPRYDKRKIREALEFLSTEGSVYSSIDEDHFKSAKC